MELICTECVRTESEKCTIHCVEKQLKADIIFYKEECLQCAVVKQRDQAEDTLAILRAERLKEAEWLEDIKKLSLRVDGAYTLRDQVLKMLDAHIASLKGDREGG